MSHPAFNTTVTRVRVTRDEWGEKSYGIELEVPARIDSTSKTFVTQDGKTLQMIYDVFLPGDADVLIDDKIKIGEEEYTVHRLETMESFSHSRMKVATV